MHKLLTPLKNHEQPKRQWEKSPQKIAQHSLKK